MNWLGYPQRRDDLFLARESAIRMKLSPFYFLYREMDAGDKALQGAHGSLIYRLTATKQDQPTRQKITSINVKGKIPTPKGTKRIPSREENTNRSS